MTDATVPTSMRAWLERGCRGLAIGALAWAAWQAVRDGQSAPLTDARVGVQRLALTGAALAADSARSVVARLREVVVAGSARPAPDTLGLTFPAIPAATVRAALAMMPSVGVPVRWIDSSGSRGLALSVASASGPRGGYVVRASGGLPTQALVLRDRGGLLDSLPADGSGGRSSATWRVASLAPPVVARVGATIATVAVPDTSAPKRLLVIAQPGWESKFTVAALEELGWRVDGSLRISPTGAVQVGAPQRLDTARYAAVIVLDSMAVDGALLTRFVTQGGGLVLAGDALRVPAVAAMRPARATAVRGALAGALLTETPRRGLEAWELDVSPGATVLQADQGDGAGDHVHAEPAVVVRRMGAGRVAATAYREAWRWRMQGSDDGAADHRRWWGGVVAAVAPDAVPSGTVPSAAAPGDAAPYADLVARIGEPSRLPAGGPNLPASTRAPWRPSAALLFTCAMLALLAEWASRRLRGLR